MRPHAVLLVVVGTIAQISCSRSEPIAEIRPTSNRAVTGELIAIGDGDWPWWRGPNRDGKSLVTDPVTTWSAAQNIVWQSDVPGRGHSTPIVLGARIYLTTANEQAQEQLLLCYDRATGDKQWQKTVHAGEFTDLHKKNSHASASPASDGERVFTVFIHGDALWVTAYDLDGEQLWQQQAGPFQSEHGYGSSPVLYKSLVIVNGDNAGSSFVAALDRESGDIVWRTARERTGRNGSYATPHVCRLSGKDQLLLHGLGRVTSYDPTTGNEIWYCEGPSRVAASTVATSSDVVFASGGYPEKEILAIRGDGSGDVTDTHVRWRKNRGVAYVPSPLYHDGQVYVVSDDGIATCYSEKGDRVWQKRLGGNFSASPILAGNLLFATNESGTTYVFEASPTFHQLAKNKLGSRGFASPVICDGKIYLRTGDRLVCIGAT